ncbi:major facilitator superfamily domain protein [Artemisia annua]|uniref:Major facilitator superfamily domain protein n=1 Tax=Artemisia annua TaxID=35608 RepID=A0A2U1KJU4_ARTAN|nr:major facilitator superfamily domain protein [Artemisia annua]PWA37035.1 major facilitator superfamily domain protein [Artemisia annua]
MSNKSELKEELLEPVYHDNCPGCKVDRDKRMKTGFPLKELIFIWVIVLCVAVKDYRPLVSKSNITSNLNTVPIK